MQVILRLAYLRPVVQSRLPYILLVRQQRSFQLLFGRDCHIEILPVSYIHRLRQTEQRQTHVVLRLHQLKLLLALLGLYLIQLSHRHALRIHFRLHALYLRLRLV